MSYCRWSSDDFQCDVYCYEDVSGGWTTHVAGNRVVFKEPLPPVVPWPKPTLLSRIIWRVFPDFRERPKWARKLCTVGQDNRWFERHNKVMKMVGEADRVPLDLPHDGESFNDATLEDFRGTLTMLRDVGYKVPNYVFDTIDEEMAEQRNGD